MKHRTRAIALPVLATGGLVAGAFGGVSAAGAAARPKAAPPIAYNTFNRNFTTMADLKSIVAKGSGGITAILPDTKSSARYTEFDAPYLSEALQKSGMPSSQITVENAQGSDATEYTMAQSAISKGAKVLIMDPLDAGVGDRIEAYAKSHGATVIDYDRLDLGGNRNYYVSFDNVQVGKLLGQGLVSCVSAWHVSKPQVLEMRGAPTDNNATLFFDGYNPILQGKVKSAGWAIVGQPPGTWDPPTALTEFQQQFAAHPNINALLAPNDENAAPIINYLQKQKHIKAKTFPVTGQDATLVGLDNILSGYQCGTVYKPIYLEAQAAVAIAVYARAGMTPPKALVNGTTLDSTEHKYVASVLLTPEWVTPANMKKTVIADVFVKAKQLCAGSFSSACRAAGING